MNNNYIITIDGNMVAADMRSVKNLQKHSILSAMIKRLSISQLRKRGLLLKKLKSR